MKPLDADRIMARAREAQTSWAALEVSSRCAVLSRMRRQLAIKCESAAEVIARETNKPLLDALSGDVMVTLEAMRYYERHAPRTLQARKLGKPAFFFRGARFETYFEPHGVVLVFCPSNYPLQLSMIPMITALVAGNAVVLKCSERTPETAALITKVCAAANLPHDLLQVLTAPPDEAVTLIDSHPDMIFFTGSCRHGQAVAERAAKNLTPTIFELGGKDAALVFADCHLERTVEGIAYGAFSNSGRVCVGVKRVYVEEAIYHDFLARLKQRISSLRVSFEPDADLCPLSGRETSVLRAQIEEAVERGATIQVPQDHTSIDSDPVLLTDVPSDARLLTEESFGPVLCMAPFSTEAQAITLANGSPFALSASVWTHSRARARRVAARLVAGSCAVNDVIRVIANPQAAFGGNRLSGYGRYRGPEGLRAFSRIKAVMLVGDRRPREIHWFPFTERIRRQLARLIRFRHGQSGFAARLNRMLPLLLALATCSAMHSESTPRTHLTIDVRLDQQAHGEIGYLIFNSPSGFPGDPQKAICNGFLPIPSGARQVHIEADLLPGTYAASVYEDRNGNHKLDRNFLGIPREPVGVSNNPHPHFGPPHFSESSFQLGSAAQTITITLVQAS